MNLSFAKVLVLPIYFTLLLCLSYDYTAQAQEIIENIRAEPKDNLVQITYDLQSDEPDLLFNITPYYLDSLEERHQMYKVEGDAGDSISLGDEKTIHWFYHREVKVYEGDMKVELVYEVLPPKVAIPLKQQVFRRASNIHLEKEQISGIRYEVVDSQRQPVFEGKLKDKDNNQKLKLPHNLPLTQDYRIRIWNDANKAPLYTSVFNVKRNIPWVLRALGLGIMIGGVYYFLKPQPTDELPAPYTKAN